MYCSCTMMSPSDTSLEEEEGADVDGAKRDGARQEGGVESGCRDLNYASLRFTVVASMAHMKMKWSDTGKWMEKWHKIFVIAEGKMNIYNGKNKMGREVYSKMLKK